MTLVTACRLPYLVLMGTGAEDLVSSGGAVAVTVDPTHQRRGRDPIEQIAGVLEAFAHLAGTGALAGPSVSARQSAEGVFVQQAEDELDLVAGDLAFCFWRLRADG